MFVALRDLRHARGRFTLMLVVIAMITFLVTFLASLTAGLSRESTSAVTDLPADHLAFAMPAPDDAPDFTASTVTPDQWQAWADAPGVTSADPLGVMTTRAESSTTTAPVTALGVEPGSVLLPGPARDLATGTVALSADAAAALAADVGDRVDVAGAELRVGAVVDEEVSFAHTPVVWTTLGDWQAVAAPRGDGPTATVVALTLDEPDATVAATDAALGTVTVTTAQARSAIGSFSAENGSLTTIQVFLLAISALVVGAFFTVWTISRAGDVAVLKALGASTRYLLRDAMGQAVVVLVLGVGAGTAVAVVAAALLGGAVPAVVGVATTLVPAVALVATGFVGAALAIVRITRIDPHAALAAR
ncbi:ABC transporter substrate-binding protein [Cellulomonas chitinilytica]|uniref:ABC transporter substrate-binding protein n=1 Tax=Cellulomonas chitinilytica TaxID=398759 RepID=A0A919U0U6_9CELL|nr:ABC transporter permease [Cellulomonas chitinilytica]GIG19867.1 ABC transporter substrate-binding protein [Cellulomonas chitinilytica]